MHTFTARDAQNRWGAVTDLARREPVMITQYGRESLMIVPADLGRELLGLRAASYAGRVAEPSPSVRRLGITEFLRQQRQPQPQPQRSRAEVDAALEADRDSWER